MGRELMASWSLHARLLAALSSLSTPANEARVKETQLRSSSLPVACQRAGERTDGMMVVDSDVAPERGYSVSTAF